MMNAQQQQQQQQQHQQQLLRRQQQVNALLQSKKFATQAFQDKYKREIHQAFSIKSAAINNRYDSPTLAKLTEHFFLAILSKTDNPTDFENKVNQLIHVLKHPKYAALDHNAIYSLMFSSSSSSSSSAAAPSASAASGTSTTAPPPSTANAATTNVGATTTATATTAAGMKSATSSSPSHSHELVSAEDAQTYWRKIDQVSDQLPLINSYIDSFSTKSKSIQDNQDADSMEKKKKYIQLTGLFSAVRDKILIPKEDRSKIDVTIVVFSQLKQLYDSLMSVTARGKSSSSSGAATRGPTPTVDSSGTTAPHTSSTGGTGASTAPSAVPGSAAATTMSGSVASAIAPTVSSLSRPADPAQAASATATIPNAERKSSGYSTGTSSKPYISAASQLLEMIAEMEKDKSLSVKLNYNLKHIGHQLSRITGESILFNAATDKLYEAFVRECTVDGNQVSDTANSKGVALSNLKRKRSNSGDGITGSGGSTTDAHTEQRYDGGGQSEDDEAPFIYSSYCLIRSDSSAGGMKRIKLNLNADGTTTLNHQHRSLLQNRYHHHYHHHHQIQNDVMDDLVQQQKYERESMEVASVQYLEKYLSEKVSTLQLTFVNSVSFSVQKEPSEDKYSITCQVQSNSTVRIPALRIRVVVHADQYDEEDVIEFQGMHFLASKLDEANVIYSQARNRFESDIGSKYGAYNKAEKSVRLSSVVNMWIQSLETTLSEDMKRLR